MNLHQEFCTPDYKLGYIDQFVEERGYGWIKDENGEQVFFHISDVLDINKAPINLKEKVCFFAVTSEKHGFDAKKINRKWDYGDIVYINDVESYGFINGIGKIKKKIHFHLDSFVNYPNSIPQKGQIVSFSSQIGDRGDSIALNVNAAEECFGEIIEWNENKGKILPTNSKNPVSLCEEDVIANQNAEKISFKIGEKVTFLFDAYKNNVFFVQSCGKLNFGVIVSVVIDKGLGYIRQGGGFEKSILFHFNSLANYPKSNPRVGQYVSFLSRVGDRGDYIALSVNMVEKCFGEVIEWGQSEFQGKILPTNSKDPISIHGKEVVVQREGAFISLEVGDTVSFLFGESEKKAILARKDLPFRKFAYNDDDEKMLQDLAEEALDEDWSYSNSSINDPYRILRNYLFYTFRRLEEEDVNSNSGEKKIQVVELEDKSNIAVFNTGLVNKYYEALYAVFEEMPSLEIGKPRWYFVGFCTRGSRINGKSYLAYLEKLPERAEYFNDQSDLLFNFKIRLDPDMNHIVGERGHRVPERIRDRYSKDLTDETEIERKLREKIKNAIDLAIKRVQWNYKAAIPQYFPKSKGIQLLLPLSLDDPQVVDVALAVELKKGAKAYSGFTILELDWAYNNARLIARPDSDWLSPKIINPVE